MSAFDGVRPGAELFDVARFDAERRPRESAGTLVRLMLLELRRSPMPLMLPVIAALFWFDALRTGQGLPAIWTQRASILPDHVMPDLGPVSAGMAAWIGGREQRRGLGDLAESTARPRWLRQLATWAGVLGWTVLAYAACTAVVYGLAARASSWGGPPVWPVVVTGLAVAVFCTTGFVAGAVFPSRFTAPLAAIGTLFVAVSVFQSAVSAGSGWILLSPDNAVPALDWGVFHSVPPDLSIVQTVFFVGVVVVLLGVLGVVGSWRGGRVRRMASAVCFIGLVAVVAGFATAATATRGVYGYEVPLLHDAASDRPIPYTADCAQDSAIPVCVHPAFAADLAGARAAFGPLLTEMAGLPGAPMRVTQIDIADLPPMSPEPRHPEFDQFSAWAALVTQTGGAPVLEYGFGDPSTFAEPGEVADFRSQAAQLVVDHIIAPGGSPGPAQQAVELGLVRNAGGSADSAPALAVAAAAQRFAALPTSTSHAWLVANLHRLQAGQVTLEELP